MSEPKPNEGAIEMYIELLTLHGFRAGWLARSRAYYARPGTDNKGRWNCACGEGGALELGDGVQAAHRQHLAEVLEKYLGFIIEAAQTQMVTGVLPGID